jgi:hypothetical protein
MDALFLEEKQHVTSMFAADAIAARSDCAVCRPAIANIIAMYT